MATSAEAQYQFGGEYADVFNAVCRAAQAEGMTVNAADPASGAISVSSSLSGFSWGENAEIRVGQAAPGAVVVSIRSSLKFGLMDWGKNKRNIDKLSGRIQEVLASPDAYAPAATPAGWYPDSTGRNALRYWDGHAWTDQVSDGGGTASSDPI